MNNRLRVSAGNFFVVLATVLAIAFAVGFVAVFFFGVRFGA
jgi:hypothetical protein